MIPHSIKRAAAPVTNGVAIDVPDKLFSPPPGAAAKIPTPGATRSGFFTPYFDHPAPKNLHRTDI